MLLKKLVNEKKKELLTIFVIVTNSEILNAMDIMIKEQDFIKKGAMQKDFFQMSEEEKKSWRNTIAEKTKETLFAKGQPLVYQKDGKMIAEYADGRIIVI